MDDLTKIGHSDRDTLATTEPYEVLQIAKRHRISTNKVYAVHKYLDSKSRAKIDAYIVRQRLAATIAPTNMLASLASATPTGMLGTNALLSLLNPGVWHARSTASAFVREAIECNTSRGCRQLWPWNDPIHSTRIIFNGAIGQPGADHSFVTCKLIIIGATSTPLLSERFKGESKGST